MITLFPRPTAGKDVDKQFENLLEDWSEEGWEEAGGEIVDLFGWSVTMKSEFSGLRLTRTLTFTPLLYLGGKSVLQVAGKIVVEMTREVKNDMGFWQQKFVPEDNAFAEVAELHGEKKLSPKESYSLAMHYFDQCGQLDKAMSMSIPIVDEKIDIDCEDPEVPKDSDGDLVADGGLTEIEVEGYLEEPECVTVIKQYDDGTTYKEEECK